MILKSGTDIDVFYFNRLKDEEGFQEHLAENVRYRILDEMISKIQPDKDYVINLHSPELREDKRHCQITYSMDLDIEEIGWIPCSERLPSEQTRVIVSVKDDSADRVLRYTTTAWLYGGVWVSDNELIHGVVAWMDFPKPYREDRQ